MKTKAIKDVVCANCDLDLRPEDALMHEGKPFCDEWCRDHYQEKIPLAAGLHSDGSIHIYLSDEDTARGRVDS